MSVAFELVGEFVSIVGAVREVLLEEGADGLDRGEEGFGEARLFEVVAHLGSGLVPEVFTALGVDGGVAHDGEGLAFGGDVDEDGVALGGFLHAHLGELAFGFGEGVGDFVAGDEDADFAGGAGFGLFDGGDDFGVIELGDEDAGFHG